MRILLVLETSGGGSGRHVVDLAGALAHRGHDVHVLYSPRRAETRFETAIRAVPGIRVERIDMARMFVPGDLRVIAAIRRYVRAHGPFDIVHGHSTKGAIACIATADRALGRVFTPHALRSRDPSLARPVRIAIGAVETVLARFAHAVIAVSIDEHAHARGIGIPEGKLRIVANGIHHAAQPSREAARRALGLDDDAPVVGFVGRLVAQKAPERILAAVAALAPRHPALRAVVVGDGPLDAPLRAEAAALGIADRVQFCGAADGAATMAAFDVFALPSRYEGMPYVLLEAAAAGLPIVAADVGGVATVVAQGRNGVVVPNWDAARFEDALERIVAEPDRRLAMGRASRDIGRAFTVDRMAAETLDVYERTRRDGIEAAAAANAA